MERDISALQQAGVPIYASPGRVGGYALDRSRTLPPLNFTPAEAVAMALGLHGLAGSPFQHAARDALRKLLAVLPAADRAAAAALAGRVHVLDGRAIGGVGSGVGEVGADGAGVAPPPMPRVVADALSAGRVLRLTYFDRAGAATERLVEPVAYVALADHWYLAAWCRLRADFRAFRTDRIRAAADTGEPAPPRPYRTRDLDLPPGLMEGISLN